MNQDFQFMMRSNQVLTWCDNLIAMYSSFPVIHKVGDVVNFVLLRSEG